MMVASCCVKDLIKPSNMGWNRLGHDLNSGWNWLAGKTRMIDGFPITSTRSLSGLIPLARMPTARTGRGGHWYTRSGGGALPHSVEP